MVNGLPYHRRDRAVDTPVYNEINSILPGHFSRKSEQSPKFCSAAWPLDDAARHSYAPPIRVKFFA